MQRRATKQSPGPNAAEKRFMVWTHECPCAACGNEGPVHAHHMYGSSAKRKFHGVSVLIGHWAILPLCDRCHKLFHTSRRGFEERYGPQVALWFLHVTHSPERPPEDVLHAMHIEDGAMPKMAGVG